MQVGGITVFSKLPCSSYLINKNFCRWLWWQHWTFITSFGRSCLQLQHVHTALSTRMTCLVYLLACHLYQCHVEASPAYRLPQYQSFDCGVMKPSARLPTVCLPVKVMCCHINGHVLIVLWLSLLLRSSSLLSSSSVFSFQVCKFKKLVENS